MLPWSRYRPEEMIAGRHRGRLLAVANFLLCPVVTDLAHINITEVDRLRVVGQTVDDRVSRDSIRQSLDPVTRSGLGRDHRRRPMITVGQDREEVR